MAEENETEGVGHDRLLLSGQVIKVWTIKGIGRTEWEVK